MIFGIYKIAHILFNHGKFQQQKLDQNCEQGTQLVLPKNKGSGP